jgi:putative ABC transport system ATP-binding protein
MIQLSHIEKSYNSGGERVEILKDFSLSVQSGEFIALMGPSGSGKSTILGLISGLLSPDSWEVQVGDFRFSGLSNDQITAIRWSNIAYIFQSFELIPTLTVRENIELPLDINPGVPRRFSVEELLDRVGLTGKSERYPNALSGWEKQRVAIARAFIGSMPYLLADEPTGNLDRKTADTIMELIVQLHKETGNTIILITHDPVVAARADRIVSL